MDAQLKGAGEAVRAVLEPGPKAARPVLAHLLADKAAPPEQRAAAALALGRGVPEPDAPLVQALADPAPAVVRRAAEALGRAGGPEAAAALASVRMPDDPAAARSLRFARLLHAARHNLQAREKPELAAAIAPFNEKLAASLEPMPPDARQLSQLKAVLAEELPGIPVAPEGAVALSCGKNRFLVVPHAGVGKLAGRGVPAVVLKRAQSLDGYALFLYILAEPAGENGLELTAWRTDGSLAGKGEARLGRRPTFTLSALDTLHLPPIQITGALEPGGPRLTMETARVSAPQRQKQRARVPVAG
jgi:hypothetical protein